MSALLGCRCKYSHRVSWCYAARSNWGLVLRKVFAIVTGILVALTLVMAFEGLSTLLYSGSSEIPAADRASLVALMARMPLPAKLALAAGWLVSPFAGAWICLRIDDWAVGGWFIIVVFVGIGVVQSLSPRPLWMHLCAIALPLVGGWLAQRLHRKPYPGEPLLG